MKKIITLLLCINLTFAFAQKHETTSIKIGEWSYLEYKNLFVYNPSPVPFSFTDEMVALHFKGVWDLAIFKEFPSYPRFVKSEEETKAKDDEAVVLYLNKILKWEKENPKFKEFLVENSRTNLN